MTDVDDHDQEPTVVDAVDDPVTPHPAREPPSQLPLQRSSLERIAFQIVQDLRDAPVCLRLAPGHLCEYALCLAGELEPITWQASA